MIAVVIGPSSSPVLALVGLAVTIAAAILVAHWGAYRPQVKRVIAVSLIALSVAAVAAPVIRAEEDFIVRDTCGDYPPWSVLWILRGCMWP